MTELGEFIDAEPSDEQFEAWMRAQFAAIPMELRERPQWVAWNLEERDGKPTKVPLRADGGGRASTTDPATWSTFDAALAATLSGGAAGVGFVFAPDDGFAGIDLDDCRDPATGDLTSEAAELLLDLDSYAEASVSGHGVHMLVRARLPERSRNRNGRGVEVYDRGRFFCCTGRHVASTPATIEDRQAELEAFLAREFPAPSANGRAANVLVAGPAPLEFDDEELLERARGARNGAAFGRLWAGDVGGYPSCSEADLALVGLLAFWAGPDASRIDSLFRRSALMRPKWDSRRGETTYGAETIARALEGRSDFYASRASATAARSTAEGAPPSDAGDRSGDGSTERSLLRFVPVGEFIERTDEPAVPVIGEPGNTLLPVGGLLILGGEGGSSKTTLTLDAVLHLASGTTWLGYAVERPLRVAIIENEGPRPQFREKLRAKRDSWQGRPWRSKVLVLEEPWAGFSFANDEHRALLREFCRAERVDLVVADPLDSLGIAGAGKPEETREFVAWLRECGLHSPEHPLAFWLLHHFSKAPQRTVVQQLSGAWGGHPDAILGVELGSANTTKLTWGKLRWATPPAEKVSILEWDVPARGFRLVEPKPTPAAEELVEAVVDYVTDHPGVPTSEVEDEVHGGRTKVRNALRLAASENGGNRLALGPGRAHNGNYWYPADHAALRSPGEREANTGDQAAPPVQGTLLAGSPPTRRGGEPTASERTGREPEGTPRRLDHLEVVDSGDAAREETAT